MYCFHPVQHKILTVQRSVHLCSTTSVEMQDVQGTGGNESQMPAVFTFIWRAHPWPAKQVGMLRISRCPFWHLWDGRISSAMVEQCARRDNARNDTMAYMFAFSVESLSCADALAIAIPCVWPVLEQRAGGGKYQIASRVDRRSAAQVKAWFIGKQWHLCSP